MTLPTCAGVEAVLIRAVLVNGGRLSFAGGVEREDAGSKLCNWNRE